MKSKNKKVLYINFVDLDQVTSGSSVRPNKMYNAFLRNSYEIEMLTGLQNRLWERTKNIFKFYKKIRKNDYDFCYIEPPSGPFFNILDDFLLLYIGCIKKVPTGLFYRDAYWKFADWNNSTGIKQRIIELMHTFDWFIFGKGCKRIYFPSQTMGELFKVKDKEVLPPACDKYELEPKQFNNIEAIYVGGMTEQYGGQILLEAFNKLNKERIVNLHLVCREEDKKYLNGYEDAKWLKVYHVSGEKLYEVYKKANLSIIPRKIDKYMDFAIPVKLYEYISFGLPIVATNCNEVAKFINSNEIGLICEDNSEALAEAINNIDLEKLKVLSKNTIKTRDNNLWDHRVKQIERLSE